MGAIKMITELHHGIYRSERELYGRENATEFPFTRAGLALALDTMEMTRIELAGSYGKIGCGETWVELTTDDETTFVVTTEDFALDDDNTITEGAALEMIPDRGATTRDEINEITARVWDGNNHIDFVPARSNDYCDESDEEEEEFGIFYFQTEDSGSDVYRFVSSFSIDPDWVCLYWSEDPSGTETDLLSGLIPRWEFHDMPDIFAKWTTTYNDHDINAVFIKRDNVDAFMGEFFRVEAIEITDDVDDYERIFAQVFSDKIIAFDWAGARESAEAYEHDELIEWIDVTEQQYNEFMAGLAKEEKNR